jgi:hypothetical protein
MARPGGQSLDGQDRSVGESPTVDPDRFEPCVDSKNSITERFGLIGLPETFYVDRRGRIEDATRGELSAAALQQSLDRASHD